MVYSEVQGTDTWLHSCSYNKLPGEGALSRLCQVGSGASVGLEQSCNYYGPPRNLSQNPWALRLGLDP